MPAVDDPESVRTAASRLLPVLPLDDVCLFPGASLVLSVDKPAALSAVRLAERTGGQLLVLGYRESRAGPRDLHSVGTVADVRSVQVIAPLEPDAAHAGGVAALEDAHVVHREADALALRRRQ